MKIVLTLLSLFANTVGAQDCTLISATADLTRSLEGLTSVVFKGFKPTITRVEGEPKLTILAYGSEPEFEVVDGKLVVSKAFCGSGTSSPTTTMTSSPTTTTSSPTTTTSSPMSVPASLASSVSSKIASVVTMGMVSWLSGASAPTTIGLATAVALATSAPLGMADGHIDCESIIEVRNIRWWRVLTVVTPVYLFSY